jgi:hypothetical protein
MARTSRDIICLNPKKVEKTFKSALMADQEGMLMRNSKLFNTCRRRKLNPVEGEKRRRQGGALQAEDDHSFEEGIVFK